MRPMPRPGFCNCWRTFPCHEGTTGEMVLGDLSDGCWQRRGFCFASFQAIGISWISARSVLKKSVPPWLIEIACIGLSIWLNLMIPILVENELARRAETLKGKACSCCRSDQGKRSRLCGYARSNCKTIPFFSLETWPDCSNGCFTILECCGQRTSSWKENHPSGKYLWMAATCPYHDWHHEKVSQWYVSWSVVQVSSGIFGWILLSLQPEILGTKIAIATVQCMSGSRYC